MKRVHTRRLIVVAATAGLAVAACGSPATTSPPVGSGSPSQVTGGRTFPVSVTAANGTVHLSKQPRAILSLSPTSTEMLYAIGAGAQVKGVDNDSNYPASAPRTKLSGFTPNVEAIVAEQPDLVVVSNDAATLTKRLAAFSIPVLSLPAPANLKGVYAELGQLGTATGHAAQAKAEVAMLRRQIGQISAAVPHHAKPLTYYYELDQTYYSVTSDTFIGRLLGLLGMKSIADAAKGATAAGGYPQLSAEYIVKANPDYIILADTICCHQDAATVAGRPGWSGIAAVKSKHVILLNDDIASRWGPRVVDLLRAVLAGIRGGP
ncbi:MAG TPA: ABC transporter substrate-binding protein [Streptosporangiaceae bacterium]|nr:ABC transporter substrate-binding protein [Streptosporangiaceae bacterium]